MLVSLVLVLALLSRQTLCKPSGNAIEQTRFNDADLMNNLKNEKLDDDEIEALSIDDSHTDQDLERELEGMVARKDKVNNSNIKEKPEIIEGDIAVSPPRSSQDGGDDIEKKSALRYLGNIWQDRKIPYIISKKLKTRTRGLILKVMDEYMKKTCLKFIDVSHNTTSVGPYLFIEDDGGCWSSVGRVSKGKQVISIGKHCANFGSITHELMHASGFFHEQSRSDRDDHVEIMWENIDESNVHNFIKSGTDTVQNFKTDYDYNSVMHYYDRAFSKNGKITIKPVKPGAKIGQRNGFSVLDLQEINALYQCKSPGGGLSEWSDWGPCLGTGDGMYKERQRYCFDTDYSKCPGVNSRGLIFNKVKASCAHPECKAIGHWSRWSSWASCTATKCRTYGTTTRNRTCTNPAPKCGGRTCPGSKSSTISCYSGNCIGPDDCEFEKASAPFCHWSVIDGLPLRWRRTYGDTPSQYTGPNGDASGSFNGTGHYLYVESSSPAQPGEKARLCSKQFPGPAKKRFAFKYHSLVDRSTKLRIILNASASGEKVIWSTIGLERNEWLSQNLRIDANEAVSVCLEYERGSDWRGDIAVDDLFFEDLAVDNCASNPCLNGGSCTNGVGSFSCQCAAGYTGPTCDTVVDNCASNPCLNGGSCTNGVGSFSCQCAAGFTGSRCETSIDGCLSNPCHNGGLCITHVIGYSCSCFAGYTGSHCELDNDECKSQPCKNGAKCIDKIDDFACICAQGFTGRLCGRFTPTTKTQPSSTATTMKPQAFKDFLSCDFECNTCSWKQEKSKDVFDWTRKAGSTYSHYTVPSFDHTTAKAGFYMFAEPSWPPRPKQNAILYTPKMNSDGQKRCIDFYYHMYGQGFRSLIVAVEYGGRKHNIFKKSGNQGNTWHRGQATLDVPAGNQFKVYIESVQGGGILREDLAIDDIRVWKGGCTGLSTPSVLACPIEEDVRFCEWSQRSDDGGNWRLKEARGGLWLGDTVDLSDNEEDDGIGGKADDMVVEDLFRGVKKHNRLYCGGGPRQALSDKADSFAVFKGRKYINKEVAILQSKSITTKEETCLRFYAFMCGKTIGSLSVAQVNENTGSRQVLKRLSGDQKDHWFETETNIPVGSDFKIEISATQGSKAIIAIDNIQVSPGKCKLYKNLFTCDFSAGNCGFKQEKDEECTWKIVKSAQGKALQWNVQDCHGDQGQLIFSQFRARLSKVFNIPPRGGCLVIEYFHHTRSSCAFDVMLDEVTPNWLRGRWKLKKNKIYFSKTRNGKNTAYVTLPPSRGGCAPKKIFVEVDLEDGKCGNFSISSISLREGICGSH